jgi:hypothetical protein
MKRIVTLAILGAGLVVGVQPAQAEIARYVSNTTWHVYTGVPPNGPIGHAQAVCLTATTPANCPAGATLYDHPGGGWSASLSTIPQAVWIWAPGITKDSHPAELAQFFFSKRVRIDGDPVWGTISVAADDFAAVRVNGHFVGKAGSTTNATDAQAAQSALTTFAIGSFLHEGKNRITIRGQNGEGSFAGCSDCTYQQHPAGVVFGVKIKFKEEDDD